MVYKPDLTVGDPEIARDTWHGMPVKAIGWMEVPHPLPTGEAPAGFARRLSAFCTWDKLVHLEAGHQDCGFCQAIQWRHRELTDSPLGNGEIRVLGNGVVYAAPSLVGHYVAVHSYLPPAEFVDAVMSGPSPDDRRYVKYRFHCWENEFPCRGTRPPPGATLGPVVTWYRRLVLLTLLVVVIALVRPYGLAVTAALLAPLAAAWWVCRRALRCPGCGKRMAMPFQAPPLWSSSSGAHWSRPWDAIYCDTCGVGVRSPLHLWGDPVAEIVTNWR